MELNRLLLWMAGVSCSLNLFYALRSSGKSQWGWRGILSGLLAMLVIGLFTFPDRAGYIVGLGWFLLVILPGLIQHGANRLLVKRQYAAALAFARVSAFLHPFDAWPDHPDLIRALRWYHEGRSEEATALISHLGRLDSSIGRLAVTMRAQQTGNWKELLAWLGSHDPERVMRSETLLPAQLQALGELGRRQEMLHLFQRYCDLNQNTADAAIGMIPLRVAALSGLRQTADLLSDALSSSLPKDAQQFWRLTARQVAGVEHVADNFRELKASASPYLATMIARRIENPLPPVTDDELDEAAIRTRDKLVDEVAHETRYAVMEHSSRRRPFATWSIAVLLIGVFVRELPGGSTNMDNLLKLGALLIPTSLTPGEWWRMLTAGLLHYGPLHLTMNVLVLLYLGSRLERAWGPVRMVTCYTIATIASMGLAPFLVTLNESQPFMILVGASGGVMGLLGALIGHLTVGWWRGGSRNVTRQLGTLLLVVCLQTAFDLSTPNVSFTCHLLGLLTGFVFSLATGLLSRRPREET